MCLLQLTSVQVKFIFKCSVLSPSLTLYHLLNHFRLAPRLHLSFKTLLSRGSTDRAPVTMFSHYSVSRDSPCVELILAAWQSPSQNCLAEAQRGSGRLFSALFYFPCSFFRSPLALLLFLHSHTRFSLPRASRGYIMKREFAGNKLKPQTSPSHMWFGADGKAITLSCVCVS